jgi:hypothetical protein
MGLSKDARGVSGRETQIKSKCVLKRTDSFISRR